MTGLTQDQVTATLPHASVWVSASAGTGKTHVLTARVLRLLVTGVAPERILCLTFTKAAAAEMKNRVQAELGQWTICDDEKLANLIYQRTGEKADKAMLSRARSLFAIVLDVPGGLRIQTIHSFCQSILARFPIEAGLSPNLEVLDERTSHELLQASRNEVLIEARENDDQDFLSAMAHLARTIDEQNLDQLIAGLASERGKFHAMLRRHGGLEALKVQLYANLGLEPDATAESIVALALSDKNMDSDGLKALAEALRAGTNTENKNGDILAAVLAGRNIDEAGHANMFPYYRSVWLTQAGTKKKTIANKGTLEQSPGLDTIIDAEQERVYQLDQSLRLARAVKNTECALHLAEAVMRRYTRKKSGRGVVDYDDLVYHTDHLLSQAGLAPWILYKLDGGIDHILVDEAQDTNPEQWRLIENLSEDFFAGKSASENTRSVFAVGDSKQSIYGFQRADPQAFKDARDRIRMRAQSAELDFFPVGLHQSFRSTRPVLDLVDAVFHEQLAGENLTPDAEVIKHATSREEEAGLVEIWPPEPHEPDELPSEWTLPTTQYINTSSVERLARRIAKRIEDMLNNDEVLASKDRAIQPGDIMILLRRRDPFIDPMVRELKSRGIPVAGTDRMVLTDQLAVMDLMALGHFTITPDDDLTLATVLKSPLVNLRDDDLIDLAPDRGTRSLWSVLQERAGEKPAWGEAVAFLRQALARVDFETPFAFYAAILNNGGRKQLLARLGNEALDPIEEFLSQCLQYEHTHPASMQGLLHWIGAGESSIKRDMEQGRNEVRIMTIHGAKGLQAPIVFLPDTCQLPSDKYPFLEVDDYLDQRTSTDPLLYWPGGKDNEAGVLELAREKRRSTNDAEHRRLLYVAMTRAEDRLYIGGWRTSHAMQDSCWYALMRKGFENLKDVKVIGSGDEAILRHESQQAFQIDQSREEIAGTGTLPDLPDWAHTRPTEEQEAPARLRPSQLDEDLAAISPLNQTAGISPYTRGRVIHSLLEILPGVAWEKREDIAMKALQGPPLSLGKSEAQKTWNSLLAILDDKQFASLFGENSRAEVSICGQVNGRPVSAQLDRIIVERDKVLIVDYKSNRPPPSRVSDAPAPYLRQMAIYEALLKSVYPDKAIHSALLWTETAHFMPLKDQHLAPHRPKSETSERMSNSTS